MDIHGETFLCSGNSWVTPGRREDSQPQAASRNVVPLPFWETGYVLGLCQGPLGEAFLYHCSRVLGSRCLFCSLSSHLRNEKDNSKNRQSLLPHNHTTQPCPGDTPHGYGGELGTSIEDYGVADVE